LCKQRALWAAGSQEQHWAGPKYVHVSLGGIKMLVKINLKWWTSKEQKGELQECRTVEEEEEEKKRKLKMLIWYISADVSARLPFSIFYPEDLYIRYRQRSP
jgi:hypothetical protein